MNMKTRSYEKELLDNDNIPFSDILTTMKELNTVNTFLGGHAITRNGIASFLDKIPADKTITVAEIGSGGGDNLLAIRSFLQKKKRSFSLTGVDIKPECIEYARLHNPDDINWICSDYRTVNWPGDKPDIIFSSLFCHHFTDDELTEQLKWLRLNSNVGFFINDLHRHPVAYYSIKMLTSLFSRSYLVKNDGPLSVQRSFRHGEWLRLLSAAGISSYDIKWQWAFRYLICAQ
jgi:2-polyprenyl-3-methyl-5-hydroxy-6-metoxy-1,4-benzoquinol methylase